MSLEPSSLVMDSDMDIDKGIKIQRMLWFDHVVRMQDDAPSVWDEWGDNESKVVNAANGRSKFIATCMDVLLAWLRKE